MKRIFLILLVVMLSGCSKANDAMDRAISMRQQVQNSGCTFRCTITADYGEIIHSFTMDCAFDPEGTMTFEVISPESISGITGTISRSKGKLTFDDHALAFQMMADGQFSPVSSPWVLMHTLRGGYLSSCAEVEDGLLLSIDDSYEEDPLRLDIRMDGTGVPLWTQILWQGRRILTMEVENFRFV